MQNLMWYTKNNYKKFIPEYEEIRSWFKVTSNRKKVRNIELWLLNELKKICEKHNIKYYADWGTLLWTIRHKWFIPRDDDIDLVMFREDYDKFLKISKEGLPDYIKLWKYRGWFSKLVNIKTAALWKDNWREDDFTGGICIDVFPIDHASKFMTINYIKSIALRFLRSILLSQKWDWFINELGLWKKLFLKIFKTFFNKINYSRIYQIHENISKKVIFKWENVYSAGFPYRFYSKSMYNKSHDVKFENTSINIPDWYDVYLKKAYWDYMKPVIYEWWHNCRYSVEKSYKDIIKSFNKNKSNEDNYNSCKDLFVL